MIIHTNQRSAKKPTKPNARTRQLEAEWQDLVRRHSKPVTAKRVQPLAAPKPYVRETPKIPSLGDSMGVAAKKQVMHYTGTKMIGIGTLHKSNAVPVFCEDEAKEMARMRRG
jgi:hypothetical protein